MIHIIDSQLLINLKKKSLLFKQNLKYKKLINAHSQRMLLQFNINISFAITIVKKL